jgi:hypothetical protein
LLSSVLAGQFCGVVWAVMRVMRVLCWGWRPATRVRILGYGVPLMVLLVLLLVGGLSLGIMSVLLAVTWGGRRCWCLVILGLIVIYLSVRCHRCWGLWVLLSWYG